MIVTIINRATQQTVAVLSTHLHRIPNQGEIIAIGDDVFDVTHICTYIKENRIEIFVK